MCPAESGLSEGLVWKKCARHPNPGWLTLLQRLLLRCYKISFLKHKHLLPSWMNHVFCVCTFSQFKAFMTAKRKKSQVIAVSWSNVFTLLTPSFLVCLWSSSSLSSFRKTPSLPALKSKFFIFHHLGVALCSVAHLAFKFQQLFLSLSITVIQMHERYFPCFMFLSAAWVKIKRQTSKSKYLISTAQCKCIILLHNIVQTKTHPPMDQKPLLHRCAWGGKKIMQSVYLPCIHYEEYVSWSSIKAENKPACGRCPLRKSNVAIVEPWELVTKDPEGICGQTCGCLTLPHTYPHTHARTHTATGDRNTKAMAASHFGLSGSNKSSYFNGCWKQPNFIRAPVWGEHSAAKIGNDLKKMFIEEI